MQSIDRNAAILGLSTAVPAYRISQSDLANWFCDYFQYPDRIANFVRRIHDRSGIDFRSTVLPDFEKGAVPRLYGLRRTSGINDRMDVYRSEAPLLAARACRGALEEAGIVPAEVTHLIVVTSTGIMTPGPDVAIAQLLGLSESVERTIVAMHGCVGGVVGLALAAQIVRGDPDARVLMVSVELCTIHLGGGSDRQTMVANSLFSDGSAAVVVGSESSTRSGLASLGARNTVIVPGSTNALQWNLAPDGFELKLSRELPRAIQSHVAAFVSRFENSGERNEEGGIRLPISSWAVHPGGVAILRGVQRGLGLSDRDLMTSIETLSSSGNQSSSAVLYALDRELRRPSPASERRRGLILGFGPGLCIDGIEYSLGG